MQLSLPVACKYPSVPLAIKTGHLLTEQHLHHVNCTFSNHASSLQGSISRCNMGFCWALNVDSRGNEHGGCFWRVPISMDIEVRMISWPRNKLACPRFAHYSNYLAHRQQRRKTLAHQKERCIITANWALKENGHTEVTLRASKTFLSHQLLPTSRNVSNLR